MDRGRTERGRGARRRGRRAPLGGVRGVALGAALLVGAAGARAAGADACEECQAPSGEALQAAAGFTLEVRDGPFGPRQDVLETDGGACSIRIVGDPTFEMVNSYLVLMGSGEVWNCPGSNSCDTMSVSYEDAASTEWSQTGEIGASIGAYGVGLSASLKETISRMHTIRVVSHLSKQQCATWCHRIHWEGYFEVGEFTCTVNYVLSRDFAWWTKNTYTGSEVHQKGHIQVDCGSGTAKFHRTAPINAVFKLSDSVCDNFTECPWFPTKDLGFFPKTAPTTPGDAVPPVPSPDPGDSGDCGDGPTGDGEDEDGGTVMTHSSGIHSTADLPEAPTGPVGDPLAAPPAEEPPTAEPPPLPDGDEPPAGPAPEPPVGSGP